MELLEPRALLAGNVLVTLSGGNATLTGDADDNSVEVIASGSTLLVQGRDGTTINGSSNAFTLSATSTTFNGNITALLGAGDDIISVGAGVTISGAVTLNGEAGDDTIGFAATANRRVTLNGGIGSDAFAVRNAAASRGLSINSSGTALINISDSTIGSSLVISTGDGADDVVIQDTTVNGNTWIRTRGGDDDIVIQNSTLHGRFYLSADRGDDVAVIDSTTIDGKSHLWMRQGDDSVLVQGTSNLRSRFFVGAVLGSNDTEIQESSTVRRLRQWGRPSGSVDDQLIVTRITDGTTGAIARAEAIDADATTEQSLALSVVVGADSVLENAGSAATTLTITRTGSTESALTVNLLSSNPARATVDSTATIPAGQTSATISISATDNVTADADATVIFTASATDFISGSDTLVVTDNEVAALTLSAAQSTIAENADAASRTFTVSRNTTNVSTELIVALSSDATSRLGVPATITIPANASSVTFEATTVNNTAVDASTPVTVTATASGLTTATAIVTVTDDDAASLALAGSPITVLENAGNGSVTFIVTRNSADTTTELNVSLSSDSTRLPVPTSVIIPAGSTSTTFTATPVDDQLFTGSTQVVVTASATGITAATSTITINDNEAASLTLASSATTLSESAASPAVTFTLSRNTANNTDALTVNLTSSSVSRLGVPATATIPAGESSVTFVGTPVDNEIADGSVMIDVTAEATGFVTAQTSVTVTDDDSANLSIVPSVTTISENAGDDTVTFTVSRNASDLAAALTVNLTSDTTSRFTVPATVTIPADAASVTFTGTPVNNTVVDGNATVVISVAGTGFNGSSVSLTVTDDDTSALSLSVSPATISEEAGSNSVTFTLARNTADVSQTLEVNVSLDSSDRLSVPSTVTFPANSATVTFQGSPISNSVVDGQATVLITVAASGFVSDDTSLTITDEDVATLSLTASPATVAENAGASAITFTVARNTTDLTQALTVNLSSDTTGRLTVPATVLIPANAASATFVAAAIDNTIVDTDLNVIVSATATDFLNGTSTVTVTDNDVAAITLTAGVSTISEASTTPVSFTLRRSGDDLSQALTVTLESGFVSRFTVPATVTIAAGDESTTFTGSPVNNTIADGTSNIVITATASGYAFGQSTFQLTDDEATAATLSLSLSASSVVENAGENASVLTITRANADTTAELVVTLAASDVTRLALPSTVTIPAGASSVTANLSTIDNTAVDGALSVTITASATGFSAQQAVLTIVDNENTVLNLTVAQNTVAETAGTLTGTITSSIASSSELVVNLAYSDITRISGPATVTIPAGETSVPITFTVGSQGVFDGSGIARVAVAAVGAALDVEEIIVTDVDVISLTTNVSSNTIEQSNGTVITRNPSFTITGVTGANAVVDADVNGDGLYDDGTTTADGDGNYSITVTLTHTTLNQGANEVVLRAQSGPEDSGDTAVNVHLAEGTVVRFATSSGSYDVELLDTDAPLAVANFLAYMNSTAYNNLIVHRSVPNFVIQGGGFTVNNGSVTSVTTNAAITNEFTAANSNLRGTLSMAQLSGQPNSGTSQWFVNVVDNEFLDDARHTVFGRVIGTGMTVVDTINGLTTYDVNSLYNASALAEVPLNNAPPTGTQITGTVSTTLGSAVLTGVGTQFTSQLAAGDSVRIGGTTFFVESIESNTSLTLRSNVPFTATLLTVLRDVTPVDADFVIFSNISELLDVI